MHNAAMHTLMDELAAAAARLVVEEGVDYGTAKRRARKMLGLGSRGAMPDNRLMEQQVRAYISIFHAETQPLELAALRRLALAWMERLADFHPHLKGPVWDGTATRRSDIWLELYCNDPKAPEIALLNLGIRYHANALQGAHGTPVPVLSCTDDCPELVGTVGIHLVICDRDDLRGALKPRTDGLPARGDMQALLRRLTEEVTA